MAEKLMFFSRLVLLYSDSFTPVVKKYITLANRLPELYDSVV